MRGSFSIYQASGGEYYYKLKTSNGELLLTGNRHLSRQDCQNEIMQLRLNAGMAGASERRMTLSTFYQFVIRNPEDVIIGKSEAFTTPADRDKVLLIVKSLAKEAEVYDLT